MAKLKGLLILFIIILSLLLFHSLYRKLEQQLQPRQSLSRFFIFLLTVLAIVFIYTFLVVFGIRLIFPAA